MERIPMGKIGSRAVINNGLIYFSGHVDGKKHSTMKEQAEALFARYDELLAEVGSNKYQLISAEVYVTDMKLKPEFNEAWEMWQDDVERLPRRVCIEVGLDEGYLVEMTLTAKILEN